MTEARFDRSRPILDQTHSLARRIGLAQLPLACIVTRFMQDVWARLLVRFELTPGGQAMILALTFACLFLLKVLTGIILAGVCAELRIEEETRRADAKRAEAKRVAEDKAPPAKGAPKIEPAQQGLGFRLKL